MASMFALALVIDYLRKLPRLSVWLAPLSTLLDALRDLEAGGARHPMFESNGNALLPGDRARLHGAIAAWADLLGRSGVPQGKADTLVAKLVADMGYRMRGARQKVPSGRTVADWRGEAQLPDAIGVDRDTFDRTVRIFSEEPIERLNLDMQRHLLITWPHLFPLPEKTSSFSGD
jgi:hypothetical protein